MIKIMVGPCSILMLIWFWVPDLNYGIAFVEQLKSVRIVQISLLWFRPPVKCQSFGRCLRHFWPPFCFSISQRMWESNIFYFIIGRVTKTLSSPLYSCFPSEGNHWSYEGFLSDPGLLVRSMCLVVWNSLSKWLRDVVETLLMWLWLMKIPT